MNIFTKPEAKQNPVIDKYKQSREIPRISIPLEHNNRSYKELVYSGTTLFGTPKKNIKGIVFIDENDNPVTDKKIQKELTTLFYNLELLFDDHYINNLSKAIVPENALEEGKMQAEFLEENLILLNADSVEGVDIVKNIIVQLPNLKRDNNIVIENFINKVKEYGGIGVLLNDKTINEVKSLYNETLMKNFEKIKLIGSGRNYYGDIKRNMRKLFKRTLTGSMGNKTQGSSGKIDYELSHLMQVVNVYENIIGMTNGQYIKYLNEIEKQRINEKNQKLRA